MPLPRVLLAEDDAAARHFVTQALRGMRIQLLPCATVAEALAVLDEEPVQLALVDLQFPVDSGWTLIERVAQSPVATAPKVVVFSGGLHAAVRERLASKGVWRCIAKPATASDIEACVGDALTTQVWPEGPANAPPDDNADLAEHERAAIETYFDGDRAFYETFRQSCVAQFVHDLADGDTACRAQDPVGLRRVAHSLKSVLQTLGYADHSLCARRLEQAAQESPWAEAVELWRELHHRIGASFGLEP